MGLFDFISGQSIDIIEWVDNSNDTILYRFERTGSEIKYGARLIVREGQKAIFLNEGQLSRTLDPATLELADTFGPGTYTLETQNLPILSSIKGWKYGFRSPFKAEVLFITTRTFTDQKWGTPNPIMLRDQDFGVVRVRAFGSYAFKVGDPARFLREIVGTDGHFTTDEITAELRNLIVSRFTDILGESRIPALDLAANYSEFGALLHRQLAPEFTEYGVELTKFLVANMSLPPEVTAAMDKRASMGALGNLDQYLKFQTAEAMGAAGADPAAPGSEGMALGVGMAMAGRMADAFSTSSRPAAQAAPSIPPPPPPASWHIAVAGETTGPFDAAQIRQMAAGGQFTGETLVWKAGMANWTKAGEVPELASLLAVVPPPPPPAA